MKSLSNSLLTVIAVVSMPLAAQTYQPNVKPFPVEVELQGADLGISAVSGQVSNVATVTLSHAGTEPVVCESTFVNGPERPHLKRARLNPGEETVLTQAFNREIIRVRVTVVCTGQ